MKDALHHLVARTWRNISADAWPNAGTVFAVGLAVSIPLAFVLLAWNLSRLADSFIGKLEVVAYLSIDAGPAQVQSAAEQIRRMPPVETVAVVTAEQALKRLAEDLPEAAGVARELGENPLPPSLEIVLKPRFRELPPAPDFTAQIARLPGVVEVDDGRQWIGRLNRLIRYLWLIALVMAVFLAAAAGLLVGHTIRLAIYRRREEIAIYRLVGATNGFIRAPLLVEGSAQGAAGGAAGLALCYGLFRYAAHRLAAGDAVGNWLLGKADPAWFTWSIAAAVVFVGAALGLVASHLSTRRFLRI